MEFKVGKFKIVGKLGHGAMGEVFRALDPVLGCEVAIKVVAGKLSEDEGAGERFLREARAAVQLTYPNIITVYYDGEGRAWPTRPCSSGNLRRLLARSALSRL
jgi:serine/threonine-protein kinase